jgi:hypothetical protein
MFVRPDLERAWQLDALVWLSRTGMHEADPDQTVREWLEEAGEADTAYMLWVCTAWHDIRTSAFFALEVLERSARELRRADETLKGD